MDERKGPANPRPAVVGRADPGAPHSNTKGEPPRSANSQHLIVGKGLALSAQHMVRHGKSRANALHACGFAQGRRTSGHSLPEGASPFPTGRHLRIRRTYAEKRSVAARRAGVDAPYGAEAHSPDGLLQFCAAVRNAEDGVPYRAGADLPNVCDHLAIAAGASGRRPLQGRCELFAISFPQRGKVASADPPRGG